MKFIEVIENNKLAFNITSVPTIADDEVLVETKAIGVNRADILQRFGKYPPPKGESDILGLEVSGVIVQCGESCANWNIGDRVMGLVPGGGYAQYCKLKASHLFSLPNSWSFTQGASVVEVFLTAFQSLFSIATIQANQKVLIHAGASGVGTAAIQLAKLKNCYVVVTTSNEKKLNACRELGADHVINYHQIDFAQWSKKHVPKGYNVIVDVVAGDYFQKNINACALDGHIVILSMLGGRYAKEIDVAQMLAKRITITASTLRNRSNEYKTNLINDFKLQFGFNREELKPVIDTIFSWQHIEQAHQCLLGNQNIGKVVLNVD